VAPRAPGGWVWLDEWKVDLGCGPKSNEISTLPLVFGLKGGSRSKATHSPPLD
jgi:hypothetical protein